MEEENKQIAEEQPEKKTRRKRRTKAEIEADNAAKAAKEQESKAGMAPSDVDAQEMNEVHKSNQENEADASESNALELSTDSLSNSEDGDIAGSNSSDALNEAVKAAVEADKPNDAPLDEYAPNEQSNAFAVGSGSYLAAAHVYDAPYANGFCKMLKAVFEPKDIRNRFVQVAYMKTGLGMVTGYIKQDEAERVFNK